MSDNIIFNNCKTGTDFENRTVDFLREIGFTANKTGRNDGGIDIVATINIQSNEYKFYIQCKYFNTTLGKHPIQEVYAGANYYEEGSGKGTPVVIANNAVTRAARMYARHLGVEIIADAEWKELREIVNKKEVTNPNQHHGLMGIIISAILKNVKNPKADKYLTDALTSPEVDDIPVDKEEMILKTQNAFDEADEDMKAAARLFQRATQYQRKAMNTHRDAIIRHLKYG